MSTDFCLGKLRPLLQEFSMAASVSRSATLLSPLFDDLRQAQFMNHIDKLRPGKLDKAGAICYAVFVGMMPTRSWPLRLAAQDAWF